MQEAEFVFSLVYTLFALGVIYPPQEFENIGLTINNVFSTFLGSIEIEFIQYQLRRTCLTLFIHSVLPTIYLVSYHLKFGDLFEHNWNSFVISAILSPMISSGIIYYWCRNEYAMHPLTKNLRKYVRNNNWLQAAIDINAEYRR